LVRVATELENQEKIMEFASDQGKLGRMRSRLGYVTVCNVVLDTE